MERMEYSVVMNESGRTNETHLLEIKLSIKSSKDVTLTSSVGRRLQ